MVDQKTDEALILAFQKEGCQEAFSNLVERHLPPLLRFCSWRVGAGHAEDVCQKAFMALIRQPFDPARGLLVKWLFQIALKQCLKHHRAQGARQRREHLTGERNARHKKFNPADSEDSMDRKEQNQAVHDAFSELPEKMRMVLHLHIMQEIPIRETSAILGLSTTGTFRMVSKAKERLRARLAQLGLASLSMSVALGCLQPPDAKLDAIVTKLSAKLNQAAQTAASNHQLPGQQASTSSNSGQVKGRLPLILSLSLAVAGLVALAIGLNFINRNQNSDSGTKKNMGPSEQSAAGSGERFFWHWDFKKESTSALKAVHNDWDWRDQLMVPVGPEKATVIRFPDAIPKRPIYCEMHIVPQKNENVRGVGLHWGTDIEMLKYNRWEKKTNFKPQPRALKQFYIFDRYIVSLLNGKFQSIREYTNPYPGNRFFMILLGYGVEEILFREMKPDEIPASYRDPLTFAKQLGLKSYYEPTTFYEPGKRPYTLERPSASGPNP